jgi:hypothetical protein
LFAAGVGKAQGREAIRELFARFPKVTGQTQHVVANPLIEVDGGRAHGVCYLISAETGRAARDSTICTI